MNLQHVTTSNGASHAPNARYAPSKSEQRLRVLDLTVDLLIARTKIDDFWPEGFLEAARLLEAVPLSTSDFHAAKRYLANAVAYSGLCEFGAASFELRMLRGTLNNS